MPRVGESVRSTRTPEGGIVLDIRQGQLFSLNLVGSTIFDLLKNGSSKAEIAEAVASQFEVSPEAAEADIGEFIESLVQHGLIECQPARRWKVER